MENNKIFGQRTFVSIDRLSFRSVDFQLSSSFTRNLSCVGGFWTVIIHVPGKKNDLLSSINNRNYPPAIVCVHNCRDS